MCLQETPEQESLASRATRADRRQTLLPAPQVREPPPPPSRLPGKTPRKYPACRSARAVLRCGLQPRHRSSMASNHGAAAGLRHPGARPFFVSDRNGSPTCGSAVLSVPRAGVTCGSMTAPASNTRTVIGRSTCGARIASRTPAIADDPLHAVPQRTAPRTIIGPSA